MTTATKMKRCSSSRRYIDVDVVSQILFRLTYRPLARAKSVCKSWNAVIKNPQFIQTYRHTNKHNNPPRFLILNGLPTRISLYGIDRNRFTLTKSAVSIPKGCTSVVSSSCGLVCLSGGLWNKRLAIFNPTTDEYFPIPNLPHDLLAFSLPSQEDNGREGEEVEHYASIYGNDTWDTEYFNVVSFGYHPRTNQYKVVQLLRDPAARVARCYVLSISARSSACCWREVEESLMCQVRIKEPAGCIDGVIYWENFAFAGENVGIVSFDLGTEKLKLVQSPWRCKFSHPFQATRHLLELENKLCFVKTECNNSFNYEQLQMDIWMLMKCDNAGDLKSWTHMHRLELGPCPHDHPFTAFFPLCMDQYNNQILLYNRGNYVDRLMFAYHLNDNILREYDDGEYFSFDKKPLIYDLMARRRYCLLHTEALVSLD